MFPTLLALAAAAPADHALDRSEVVVDCSSWTGRDNAVLDVLLVPRRGEAVLYSGIEVFKGGDPDDPRSALWVVVDQQKWRHRTEKDKLVVQGPPGGGGVSRVAVLGDTWSPVATRRPAGPGWVREKK